VRPSDIADKNGDFVALIVHEDFIPSLETQHAFNRAIATAAVSIHIPSHPGATNGHETDDDDCHHGSQGDATQRAATAADEGDEGSQLGQAAVRTLQGRLGLGSLFPIAEWEDG
jgi:hypothetical protein